MEQLIENMNRKENIRKKPLEGGEVIGRWKGAKEQWVLRRSSLTRFTGRMTVESEPESCDLGNFGTSSGPTCVTLGKLLLELIG